MSVQRRPFSDLKNTQRIHMPSAAKLSTVGGGGPVGGDVKLGSVDENASDRRFSYLPMEDRFEDCRQNLTEKFEVLEDDLPSSNFDYEAVFREYQRKCV